MSKTSTQKYTDDEDGDDSEESHIEWSNLIFLPFHPVFKLIVLCSVITKSILGPVQSIYPIVYCSDVMDSNSILLIIKYFYSYCCDSIYGIDTFLHIVHRQVTDKAMRREHLPKSELLLLVDIMSLIPFFRLMVSDMCPTTQLWPNVLAFNEFFVIYRVLEYFSLVTTHSFWKIVTGFTLMLGICINCANCFWLLLTKQGLCTNCNDTIYDWRIYVMHKLNETDERFTTYIYGTSFVLSFTINRPFDETKPSTILEFIITCLIMLFGYLLTIFVVLPKLFAESILRLRSICAFHPHVQRIIQETKRRNSSPKAYIDVQNFYNVMWKKRSGITIIPEVISELPRYLRLDIRQDLVWPVFYHSPSLRKTSTPFKRWLCEYIRLDYKLPGEKFFAGPHCHSNLYYLKTGVVQFISADDGTTPILSVTSGTIFGDISFLVPPLKRKLLVRCLTYCEVFIVSRIDILKALHIFPDDCRHIFNLAKERMKHARTLYICKQNVKGLDRAEDEGIAWIKRRWWEISDAVSTWKKKSIKKELKLDLPPEEAVYHCAKYIGQLALCTDVQLNTKSMFANVKFPWILIPQSSFGVIWNRIVMFTVFLVLILYPPNISRQDIPPWFRFFQFWTDLIYASDICVSLLTSVMKQENVTTSFASVMFARCKSLHFFLDVLSTLWVEYLAVMIGKPEFFYMVQFNRLIKIYILFIGEYLSWEVIKNPMTSVYYKIVLAHFSFVYILGYFIFMIDSYFPDLTTTYFFGIKYCSPNVPKTECNIGDTNVLVVAISWTFELFFPEYLPHTLIDIYLAMAIGYASYMIYMYCETRCVASLYLNYREVTNYQYFVSNLRKYYQNYKIHHNLLKRLNRYLMCHWKYYQGVDVMHPNLLKDEPYDIYWKVHGEVAEKIISESQAFAGADHALIRELAYTAKFMILPKNSILFLFGVQCINVTWIVKGHIKCEYHNKEGVLLKTYYDSGYLLSASSVFLGKPSLRTYTSCTDCEILYIRVQDFFEIIKRYPNEWSYFETCIQEFEPVFDEMFHAYLKKHRNYQKKLRDRIFHARMSLVSPKVRPTEQTENRLPFEGDFWTEPESEFMKIWMFFRAIIVFVSITSASLQGGSGAMWRWQLIVIGAFCDCISWIDIVIKIFLSYYDERGILISDKRKCMLHYLSRGFILDIIGAIPWYDFLSGLMTRAIHDDNVLLINTFCKFAHLYILLGYFNYMSDAPSINVIYIKILKLQIFMVLVMLGASQFLMSYCVTFEFNSKAKLVRMTSKNGCWIPKFFELAPEPTVDQLHILFAESLNLAQCGFMRTNFGRFHIDRHNLGVGIALFILGVTFWYVMCYSLTLLVLNSRGNTLFQHGVSQLRRFLNAERVEKRLTEQVVAHFRYWWLRTKGINIHHLSNERIGVIFRQDLSYYFFKKTFTALDTLLLGGESLQRQLASVSTQVYFLPGEEILREMDLTASVFVVHRGKVIISQNGEKLATLTKGGIFGQLDGITSRPVRISATCDDYADLLQINIKPFQDLIGVEVRANIAQNPESKNDYMATKRHFYENPYNSIKYILRGRKTIKLPWMKEPIAARHGNWYSRWLYLVWLAEPFISTTIVLILYSLQLDYIRRLYWALLFLDIIHLANLVMEFFMIELIVVDNKLVNRVIGWRLMKQWDLYVDALSFLVPLLSLVTDNWQYQLARLLRLHLFYNFHFHFCRSFKSKAAPILMKFLIVFLFLHAMSCGWIYVACRNNDFPLANIAEITPELNTTIDYDQWAVPSDRKGGCARVTKNFDPETRIPSFVVPKYWFNDYIVALTYIIIIFTHTSVDTVIALTIGQVYYKVIVNFFIYWINMWMISVTMSAVYIKFRELYQYDYEVISLIAYLNHGGLSPALLESVKEYTNQLWRRQRGNWLPELAQQAPLCLREDLLGALYMHHLKTPALFRQLPPYFTRQLVARFQRIVIFPGKCIVQEGDIFSCIYFIHEGEVEKWFRDANGDSKMSSLLTTNGYFGFIPGLFPKIPFQFTYYSRTVVDLVFLRLKDWQDLLDNYPDVKRDLYAGAKQLKRDLVK